MSTTNKAKVDVHQQVTDCIVEAIEKGAGDWQMPWHRVGSGLNRPVNIDTGNAYRGVNLVALWAAAEVRDFGSGTWGTYRQWQNRDCQVRKGEKSSVVVFYKEFDVDCTDEESMDAGTETRLFAKASRVFNADQVDGFEQELPEPKDPVAIMNDAEQFILSSGADIRHGGTRACYSPYGDFIQVPERDRFVGSSTSTATEAYYGTLLHELTHWTGPSHRCDRQFGKRFGDDAYAAEELVAELGSAFLCADLGVTPTPRADHAAYLDHWLRVLKADKKAIFTAASKASQAVDYLIGLQSKSQEAAA